MKELLLFLLITLLPFSSVLAQKISESVRIPKVLEELGFTRPFLIEYKVVAGKEFFTFDNWKTVQGMDTITFVMENGIIKDALRGKRIKLKEKHR